MQSVGEVMAIGRTFRESIQKAFRSLEVGIDGLEPKWAFEQDPELKRARLFDLTSLRFATSFRLLKIREAFLNGKTVDEIFEITKIDPWFLHQINLIDLHYFLTLLLMYLVFVNYQLPETLLLLCHSLEHIL